MAKIRAIIIEGEMTPAELKEYSDAFWHGTPANHSRAVAVSQVDLRDTSMEDIKAVNAGKDDPKPAKAKAPKAEAPAPAPEPVPVPAAPVVEAAPEERLTKLSQVNRVTDLLRALQEEGFQTFEALLDECKKLQPLLPNLQRMGDSMQDRLARAFESMK
jgi:hypothetical protein